MPPIVRGLLPVVFISVALGFPAATAQTLPAADMEVMRSALAAAQGGDWNRAYAVAATATGPLPVKMLHWMDYARPGAPGHFPDIAEFIEKNPGWPGQKALRKHAEEALAAESDAVAAEWFKRYPPVSPTGKIREAEMMNSGNLDAGIAALRALWIAADFNPLDEKNFLARHSASLRPEDYTQRIDRLLWDGQSEAAHRMLGLVPSDYRPVAEARLALVAQAANAEALVGRVPARLRSDPGLVFEQLRWRRKKDMTDAAVQILLAQPNDLVRPAAWWAERQAIARRVLAGGNAELAYRIVEQHGLIEGNAFSEAQFLLGYVALRYMKQPARAFEHFAQILTRVDTPHAKARAGYWGGRAAEAQGKSDLAAKWYAAGADHMATFYGQLAAHQLGHDAPPRPVPEPVPDLAERAQFDDDEVVRAARTFFELGDAAHGKIFLLHLADNAKTPAKFAMLANLAENSGRIDLAIAVAKRAIEAGTPLMIHGYPVTAIPNGGTAEHSLLFAIMRQESAFERDAVSRVGARGLMQLMPATASFIANKMQLPFSADRLTADGIYNVLIGRGYLETLIDDFGGSYALAIASYNGGPSRVRQWIHDYGDPRGGNIDMVDWIEMIPINETRNYVQRVLENLQIYRGQVGRVSAFSLASDLAR
ncbi:MAG TPA: lytic transglycosylase domain-containing protein [Stellaceae bacterium]|nr:lytic transglycosylase domain-containing protein [Stellaceae bacterium]